MHPFFQRNRAAHLSVARLAFVALAAFPFTVGAIDSTVSPPAPTSSTQVRAPATAPVATLNPSLAAIVRRAVSQQNYNATAIQGGAFAQLPYSDICSDGILIGFRIGLGKFFNNDVIKSIQPIYLTPAGEQFGNSLGGGAYNTFDIKAPEGYAIGAITIRGGGGLDAVTMTVMRITPTGLDQNDERISQRIGGPGGGEAEFDGKGCPAIGITGRIDPKGQWLGLGMVFLNPSAAQNPPAPPAAPAAPTPPLAPGLKAVQAPDAAITPIA